MHVNVVPAVSAVTVTGSHAVLAERQSGSSTVHETETSDVYQPFDPTSRSRLARTTGAVMSSVAGRQSQAPR